MPHSEDGISAVHLASFQSKLQTIAAAAQIPAQFGGEPSAVVLGLPTRQRARLRMFLLGIAGFSQDAADRRAAETLLAAVEQIWANNPGEGSLRGASTLVEFRPTSAD